MKIVSRIILTGAVLFSTTAIVNAENCTNCKKEKGQHECGKGQRAQLGKKGSGSQKRKGAHGQQRGRVMEMLPAAVKAQLKGKEPKVQHEIVKKWTKANPEAMKKFRETMRAQHRKGGIFTILPADVKAQLKGKDHKECQAIIQKWVKANPETVKKFKEENCKDGKCNKDGKGTGKGNKDGKGQGKGKGCKGCEK